MLATALAPEIGYDAAAKLAKEALRSGRTIRELAAGAGHRARAARRAPRPSVDDRARARRGTRRRLSLPPSAPGAGGAAAPGQALAAA